MRNVEPMNVKPGGTYSNHWALNFVCEQHPGSRLTWFILTVLTLHKVTSLR